MIAPTDHSTIRAVSPTTWIKSTDYCKLAFSLSLRAIAGHRTFGRHVAARLGRYVAVQNFGLRSAVYQTAARPGVLDLLEDLSASAVEPAAPVIDSTSGQCLLDSVSDFRSGAY